MARIIDNQTNVWGRQTGADPQRSDLWVVDFTQALSGLATALRGTEALNIASDPRFFIPAKLAPYYARSVALPSLNVRSEPIKRDSRPYPMPSWDEPLEPVRMVFILDCAKQGQPLAAAYRSDIYQMLEYWRMVVRAGRGPMSNEFAFTLNGSYRIDYAFNVRVSMLRSSSSPTTAENDLEFSARFDLVNCWLSSFKIGELNYEGNKMVEIDATFYAEDVLKV
jgi:hypothetical protein